MIRRSQLLGAESRFSVGRVMAASGRIRDGLLRDNKVIPAVLAVLALLIFAWILAGALIGGEPSEEKAGQVASQASQAQAPQDSDSGGPETPAPGVENRDTDSYSAFEKKNPFGDIGLEKADDDSSGGGGGDNGNGDGNSGSGDNDNGRGDNDGGDNDNGRGGDDGVDNSGGGRGDDFIDEPSPGDSDSGFSGGSGRDRGSGGAGRSSGGDDRQGGAGQGGQGGDAGQGGRDDGLFDSGGNLAVP